MIEMYCEKYYTVLTLVNYLENSPFRLSQVVLSTFSQRMVLRITKPILKVLR